MYPYDIRDEFKIDYMNCRNIMDLCYFRQKLGDNISKIVLSYIDKYHRGDSIFIVNPPFNINNYNFGPGHPLNSIIRILCDNKIEILNSTLKNYINEFKQIENIKSANMYNILNYLYSFENLKIAFQPFDFEDLLMLLYRENLIHLTYQCTSEIQRFNSNNRRLDTTIDYRFICHFENFNNIQQFINNVEVNRFQGEVFNSGIYIYQIEKILEPSVLFIKNSFRITNRGTPLIEQYNKPIEIFLYKYTNRQNVITYRIKYVIIYDNKKYYLCKYKGNNTWIYYHIDAKNDEHKYVLKTDDLKYRKIFLFVYYKK